MIGYGQSAETQAGVWTEEIVERKYYGDIIRNTRRLDGADKVNSDLSVSNAISVIADAYAVLNFAAIRYVVWNGEYWTVDSVEVERPRLILRPGGVYNGPKAGTSN